MSKRVFRVTWAEKGQNTGAYSYEDVIATDAKAAIEKSQKQFGDKFTEELGLYPVSVECLSRSVK